MPRASYSSAHINTRRTQNVPNMKKTFKQPIPSNKSLRKLVIQSEIIALLTSLQLSNVAGGVSATACPPTNSETGPC